MAHPGYEVKRPFTMLRYVLVAVIVEIVDRDPKQLNALPVELWKVLCSWFFRYPHNNLYHGVFYKLVFKALRCNNVGALRMAVSKGRLVAQLVDSHIDGDKVGVHTVKLLCPFNQTRERAKSYASNVQFARLPVSSFSYVYIFGVASSNWKSCTRSHCSLSIQFHVECNSSRRAQTHLVPSCRL